MNYAAFEKLCNEHGTTPTALALKLGLSKGNTTSWKKGGNPSVEILMQLSDELNCTTDYLLGRTTHSNASNNKIQNIFSTQIEDEIVNTKYCSYSEFVSYFNPKGKLVENLDSFIFRGESSAIYDLIPTALRPNITQNAKYKNFLCELEKNEWKYEYSQVFFEYIMLFLFYKSANKSGLKLPYVQSFEKEQLSDKYNSSFFENLTKDTFGKWINEEFEELAALAQHYGVPTRLLDWSFDYKVAMYFAASNACKNRFDQLNQLKLEEVKANDYMVIWAINKNEVDKIKDIPLKFVVPNYYRNPNLNAQKGILSHWESRTIYNKPKSTASNIIDMTKRDFSSLPKLLLKYSQNSKLDVSKILYKFKIPVLECAEMLDYLYNSGYNAANIFPGYDGVVKSLNEKTMINELLEKMSSAEPLAARDTVNNEKPSLSQFNADCLDNLPTMDEE